MKSHTLLMFTGNIAWWFVSVVYGSQSGGVRLVNGPHNCTGDAQIFYNGTWMYLSLSISWRYYEALYRSNSLSAGLCSQLGCGNIVSLSSKTIGSTNVLEAQCTGGESAIRECYFYFQSSGTWISTLTCSGNVRLVNGSNECSGRVELLYNSQWVSLYETGWTTQQSNLVCSQLGCGQAVATGSGGTPGSALQALCSGAESALQSCSFQSCSSCAASNSRSVAVVCSGGVRLVNGPHNCTGDAQIFYNGTWMYLSLSIRWRYYEALYRSNSLSAGLCSQLGCGNVVSLSSKTIGSTNVLAAECTGGESAIRECYFYFQSSGTWISTLTCSGNVRLVNGSNECSGRVELLYNSQWVSLYETGWTTQQSNLVCSQLGCGQAVATGSGGTPGSALQALCSGAESALQSCSFQSCSSCAASNSRSVAVVCSGGVRLVNGPHNCTGDAQIFYNGTWMYLSLSIRWRYYEALYRSNSLSAGLCSQLGCGNVVSLSSKTIGSTNVLAAECTGGESAIRECYFYFQSSGTWISTLTCSGNVRLVNGSNECSGRVELLYNSQWVSLYETGWTTQQSNLVCSQLGCGQAVATGSGGTPGSALQALCSGAESALQSCSFQSCSSCAASNSRSVAVVCSGGVRLVNGPHNCTGDAQIFYNGTWMYLSLSIRWRYYEALYRSNSLSAGLCSQLGCGNVVSLSSKTIGSTNVLAAECTGGESAIRECYFYFQSSGTWISTLTCSGNVRLVNGSNECSGRVELLYNSQWVSLYETGWTTQQSNLVCSQLGCGQAVATGSGGTPGSALQALCSGAESALQSCSFQSCSSCAASNSRSVAVVCSGGVRLVNGPHNCTGDAQIFYNGTWMYLSLSIRWRYYEALYRSNSLSAGLCSQLGCGNVVSLSSKTIGSTNVLAAECTGGESAIRECYFYFQSSGTWISTLTCSGNVRLVNGSNECSGRVELLYNSQWVSLYETGWTTQQSNLVCSQLGCGQAVATGSGGTPGSALQALCSGAESALQSCSFQSCSSCAASNSRSVAVVCSGGVRLVNGPHNCTGDAQIFYNGTWMYLSLSIRWRYYEALYLSNSLSAGLCSQLGCGNVVSLSSKTIGSTNVLAAECTGGESAIRECYFYFQSSGTWISTLTCSGNVRLVNGSNECSGRVELLYNSQWVSLYETGWTTQQSNLVCSQLGCGQAVATGSGGTPGSALQALCSGAESALQSCSFQSCSSCAASNSRSVAVVCSGGVRLVNGPHNCTGDAQIFYNGTWMYLSLSIRWRYYEALYRSNSLSAGLCSQLGCGNVVSLSSKTIGSTNVLAAECTGGESAIRECYFYFQSSGTWISTLTCSGSAISVTPQLQTTEATAFEEELVVLLNSNGQITTVLNGLLDYLQNNTNLSEGKAEKLLTSAFESFYNRSDNGTGNIESANILLKISETIAFFLIEPNATYSDKTLKTKYLEIRVTVGSNTSQILPLVVNGNEMRMNSTITPNNGSVSATLISYVEMEKIMTASYFKKDNGAKMFSSVVAAFLKQMPAMGPIDVTEPIIFKLQHNQMKPQDGLVACVYWNDTGKEKFWSESGCTATYTDDNYTECSCTHLSIFALILQVDDNKTNDDLTMMSKIFEITGLAFFALAIITFALTSQKSKVNNTARLNLCISLFLAHLLFLTGSDQTENQVICSVIAGSLHFLFLASFVWMFLEAVQLVMLMRSLREVKVLRKQGLPCGYLLMFGYLFPAIIVAITAGLFPEGYGDQKQCWLKEDKNLRWSFLGPVILILSANYILFLMIIWNLYFFLALIQQDISTIKDVRMLVLKNCVQFVILGCSWVLGFFPEVKMFAVLFIMINSQQGTFIFLIYCLFNTQVREQYKKWFGCLFHKKKTEGKDTKTQSSS